MKIYLTTLALLFTVVISSCKKNETPDQILAGDDSKIWQTIKQTNAMGDKEKLSKEEKKEKMQFYSNGNFTILASDKGVQGKWDYEENSKNLSLQMGSAQFTENFTVVELKDKEMTLKAADGSLLVMEAED